MVVLLLVAWALRLPPTLDNRFHPDEALYGYWGLLVGHGRDPWLARVPVYKPPLLPYLVAGAQALFGIGGGSPEFTVRSLGLAAGLLTVSLAAGVAYALYRDRWTAAVAAVGVAFSPFAVLFSATAFPDPLMVALGLGACGAAARGRSGWAGLLAGLAFAAKQTGLVFLPLALGVYLVWVSGSPSQAACAFRRPLVIGLISLGVGFSVVVGLMFAWDLIRIAQGAESFWRIGIIGYGGLRLIWPQELWARLRGWVSIGNYFFASPVVNGALLIGLPMVIWRALMRRRWATESLADLQFVFFCLIYFVLHWLWAFPVWDRYLMPLVPVLAILLGRTLILFASHLRSIFGRWSSVVCHLSFVILLVFPAWNAAHSRYPVGGDHGAYDGIDEVVAFLRRLPEGAVIYQHWLGWHYDYYLFDEPIYLAYWPTPAWLARDVQAFGAAGPRYVTFPSWESPARVGWALADVGYELEPVLETTRRDGTASFAVYRILPVTGP